MTCHFDRKAEAPAKAWREKSLSGLSFYDSNYITYELAVGKGQLVRFIGVILIRHVE